MIPILARADPVVLKAGQKAPKDGVFYSNDAHARLVSKIKIQDSKHKQDLDYWKRKLTLEMNTALKLKGIEIDVLKQRMGLVTKAASASGKFLLGQVSKARSIPWYKSPTFVAVTTFVLTIGVGAFSVWTVNELSD